MKESEEIKLYNRIKQFIYDRSAKEEPPGMQILHRMNDDDIRYLGGDIIFYLDKSYPHL